MKNFNRGFTLIELMVVLVVAAIVMMVAVPSFTNIIEKNRIEAVQKDFARDMAFARQAAATRNNAVSICKSSDGSSCTTAGDWNQGWIVFVDVTGAGTVNAGEEILKVHAAVNSNDDMEGSVGGVALNYMRFLSTGALQWPTAGTPLFEICAPANSHVRGLLVLRSGRALTSRQSSSGVDYVEMVAGTPVPLTCS